MGIGNAAPVQLGNESKVHPGRILLPYTRNNFKHWLVYSDDDGMTWAGDRELPNMSLTAEHPDCDRNMSYFGYDIDKLKPGDVPAFERWVKSLCAAKSAWDDPSVVSKLSGPWQFVESGPPASLQLKSGRVLVPAFHGYIRGVEGNGDLPVSQLYNNLGYGHTLISDDDGDTWHLGKQWPSGPQGGNENQYVQLSNGSVLTNMRSLSTGTPQWRLQARSDDEGETWTPSVLVHDQQQPFNGCQGSALRADGTDTIYVASPDPLPSTSALQKLARDIGCNVNLTGRTRLTLYKSTDGGTTYPHKYLLDSGLSAQTSLQVSGGKTVLLYEQADDPPDVPREEFDDDLIQNLNVLIPARFMFREIPALPNISCQTFTGGYCRFFSCGLSGYTGATCDSANGFRCFCPAGFCSVQGECKAWADMR